MVWFFCLLVRIFFSLKELGKHLDSQLPLNIHQLLYGLFLLPIFIRDERKKY